MSTNELQPDVDQVLQLEPAGTEPVVKVSQQGPVCRTLSISCAPTRAAPRAS